jgi:hypothetical protein
MENQILDENPQRPNNMGGYNLPNSTAVLVLGILSILGCFCYGIVGLILGIIALVLAQKDLKMLNASPSSYNASSANNMKAGRVCAIIGVCLSGLYFLILVGYLVIVGSMISMGSFGF